MRYNFSPFNTTIVVKPPKISAAKKKKFKGQIAISLNGEILGIGENAIVALKEAKKQMEDIEKEEFLVSRIHDKEILAV